MDTLPPEMLLGIISTLNLPWCLPLRATSRGLCEYVNEYLRSGQLPTLLRVATSNAREKLDFLKDTSLPIRILCCRVDAWPSTHPDLLYRVLEYQCCRAINTLHLTNVELSVLVTTCVALGKTIPTVTTLRMTECGNHGRSMYTPLHVPFPNVSKLCVCNSNSFNIHTRLEAICTYAWAISELDIRNTYDTTAGYCQVGIVEKLASMNPHVRVLVRMYYWGTGWETMWREFYNNYAHCRDVIVLMETTHDILTLISNESTRTATSYNPTGTCVWATSTKVNFWTPQWWLVQMHLRVVAFTCGLCHTQYL